MRKFPVFLVTICLAALAAAQTSINPYEIAKAGRLSEADVSQLWRALGISEKIRQTTARGPKDTNKNFSCESGCEVEARDLAWSLVEDGGNDMVVRISRANPDYNLSRFLVFHHDEAGWRLVDYLDLSEWVYDLPEASVVHSGRKRWLIVKAWPHCGTGCSLIHTDWFELKNGKLRIPVSGHQVNENPGRQFETRFVRAVQSKMSETLEFVYHVEFSSGFGSSIDMDDLWDDEKLVRFSRPNGEVEFKFDSAKSEASEAFVKEFFSEAEVGQPRLLDLVQGHLLEIARGRNNRLREWLKELLEKNPNQVVLAPVRQAFAKAP